EAAALACELAEAQRLLGVRDLLQVARDREAVGGEHALEALDPRAAEARLELRARDPLGRVLRVQVEGPPVDAGAVPALQPRGPLEADVAERSYVVAPDAEDRFAHAHQCTVARWSS